MNTTARRPSPIDPRTGGVVDYRTALGNYARYARTVAAAATAHHEANARTARTAR